MAAQLENTTVEAKWGTYMPGIYFGRKAPYPLGTVLFDEIEEKARETLKNYPGTSQMLMLGLNGNLSL